MVTLVLGVGLGILVTLLWQGAVYVLANVVFDTLKKHGYVTE